MAELKTVLLAAGLGERLGELTRDRPKALLEVGGQTLIDRSLAALQAAGAGIPVAITGHRSDCIEELGVEAIYNERYADANNVYSLWKARELVSEGCLIVNSDVVFEDEVACRLVAAKGSAVLCDTEIDLDAEAMKVSSTENLLTGLSKGIPLAASVGEYIGLARIDPSDGPLLVAILDEFIAEARTDVYYEDAILELARRSAVSVVSVGGLAWAEIDDYDDLAYAETEIAPRLVGSWRD